MAQRDYVSTPVSDALGLKDVVLGLSKDLQDMRAGKISPAEGTARAAVAKQIFNGVRLYIQAAKMLESAARPVPEATQIPETMESDDA